MGGKSDMDLSPFAHVPGPGDLQEELIGYCSQCAAAVFRVYRVGQRCPGKIKFQCPHQGTATVVKNPPLLAADPAGDFLISGDQGLNWQKKDDRPSLDQYFMAFATVASLMSTCQHRKEGAVAVQGKRIIATGYNGAPVGLPHCNVVGCSRDGLVSGERLDICRAVHAEENVLLQCAQYGPSCKGATIYTTLQPCLGCAKSMVNAGIARVVYEEEYSDRQGLIFLEAARVKVEKLRSG